MRVVVTGTPGTGKTTATERLETDLDVIHLNDLVEREGLTAGVDEDRGSWIADLDAIRERLAGLDDVLVESHLAHRVDADRVIVLRCHPGELAKRLRERGESAEKANENAGSAEPPRALEDKVLENAEAEALDVVLAEAVDAHGEDRVFEIDTTERTPDAVAREIEAVLAGGREPSAGVVDFTDYL